MSTATIDATTTTDGGPAFGGESDARGLVAGSHVAAAESRILIGYARCSTERQDLSAQRRTLRELGVSDDRVYLDHGLTGTNRSRPGLEQALAAVREGDTLVVPKLDRLAPFGPRRPSDRRLARRARGAAVAWRDRV